MTQDATPAQTRNRKAWKLILAIAVALVVLNVVYPFVWFSTEFRARVVDESTGRPVSGAIVLANWELVGGFHPDTLGQLVISEVVTGSDGVFRIPAWGPRFALGLGRLEAIAPRIRILHPGYYPLILDNQPRPMTELSYAGADTVIRYLYQDQELNLKPRGANLAAYEQALNILVGHLSFIYPGRNCDWRSAPRTLAFIDRLAHELSEHDRRVQLYYVWQLGEQAHCGPPNPADLVKEYLSGLIGSFTPAAS